VDAVFIRDKAALLRSAIKETVYSSLLAREFARELNLISCLLRKIFGPEMDVVTGEWRRLHNEELYDLYCSPNIIRAIKPRIMRCEGYVMLAGGEERCIQGFGGKTCGKETTWET
jgi:hypothetical protein